MSEQEPPPDDAIRRLIEVLRRIRQRQQEQEQDPAA
jgi:hypothetical protein